MTMLANCRAELYKDAYPKDEKNPYWEGFLNKSNKQFIAGYDEAVKTIRKITYNILDDDNFTYFMAEYLHRKLKKMIEELTTWVETGGEELKKEKFLAIVGKYPVSLQVAAALWVDMQVKAEVQRNKIIISMIDGQEEIENE